MKVAFNRGIVKIAKEILDQTAPKLGPEIGSKLNLLKFMVEILGQTTPTFSTETGLQLPYIYLIRYVNGLYCECN